jgi:hypothetical protein
MDKASVIAIRNALQYEENRTIRIAFDNGVNLSNASDIILWKDDAEIVIGIMADNDSGSYSAGLPIKVICSTYENIQFIMGNTNNDNMDKTLEGLISIVDLSDEDKTSIKEWYTKLYSYEYELSHKNYNPTDIIRD